MERGWVDVRLQVGLFWFKKSTSAGGRVQLCPGVVSPEDVQRRVREDDRCTPWLVVVQFDTELMVRVRDGSVQLVQYQ